MGGRARMGDKETPTYLRLMQLKGAGISDEAIASYATPGRLGADNADPYRLVGAAQSAGLSSTVISSLLQQIAQNTHAVASRGIKVDMDSATAWVEKAVSLGKSPELAAQAYGAAQSGIGSLRDRFLQPFQGFAEAKMLQPILAGAGSYEDIISRLDAAQADPTGSLGAVDDGSMAGRLGLRAFTGIKGMEGVAGATRPGAQGVTPLSRAIGRDEKFNPFTNRSQTSWREWNRWTALQASQSFAGQQFAAASVDRGAMEWSFLNDIKGAIMEFATGSNNALQQLMQSLDSIQPSGSNP
jgi:hypothetical protein